MAAVSTSVKMMLRLTTSVPVTPVTPRVSPTVYARLPRRARNMLMAMAAPTAIMDSS